jgi:hypothetical protein
MRRLSVSLGIWLAVLAGAAHAAPMKPIDRASGGLVSDGVRWAAYETTPNTTRILDTRKRTTFEVTLPADCPEPGLRAIGGGQALWQCTWDGEPLLLDIRTRIFHRPPPLAPLPPKPQNYGEAHGSRSFLTVGSHWLLGLETYSGSDGISSRGIAFNWRTGDYRYDEPATARALADPNAAALGRLLCRPLQRRRYVPYLDDESGPVFAAYQYERPFGLTEDARYDRPGRSLVLDRCGRHRSRTLATARKGYQSAQLGARYVTWTSLGVVHGLVPRTGRRYRWSVGAPRYIGAVHTATRVLVVADEHIYSAPAPKR